MMGGEQIHTSKNYNILKEQCYIFQSKGFVICTSINIKAFIFTFYVVIPSFVLSPPINFSQADWENTLAVHLCHSFSAVTVTANCLFTFHPEKPAYWGLNTVKSGGLPTFQNYFPNRHVMGGGSFSGPGKGSGVEKDNIWWGKSVTPDQGCHPVCVILRLRFSFYSSFPALKLWM